MFSSALHPWWAECRATCCGIWLVCPFSSRWSLNFKHLNLSLLAELGFSIQAPTPGCNFQRWLVNLRDDTTRCCMPGAQVNERIHSFRCCFMFLLSTDPLFLVTESFQFKFQPADHTENHQRDLKTTTRFTHSHAKHTKFHSPTVWQDASILSGGFSLNICTAIRLQLPPWEPTESALLEMTE